jgi:hypothetical protein
MKAIKKRLQLEVLEARDTPSSLNFTAVHLNVGRVSLQDLMISAAPAASTGQASNELVGRTTDVGAGTSARGALIRINVDPGAASGPTHNPAMLPVGRVEEFLSFSFGAHNPGIIAAVVYE